MRRLWRRHRLLTIAFLLAGALTAYFAVRLAASWIYWNDPAHRDVEIAGWMTPRYVAHSWRLPPELVADALDLERRAGRPLTLADIAAERGLTVEELAARLEAAAAAHRAADQ
jgi:hypothetical protein